MVFLHAHGVGTARAVRIFKTYGADAVQVIDREPLPARPRHPRHRLPHRRRRSPSKLGIEPTAMIRVRAGISFALAEATGEGHCGLPVAELMRWPRAPDRGAARADRARRSSWSWPRGR